MSSRPSAIQLPDDARRRVSALVADPERQRLLHAMAELFDAPAVAVIDWEVARASKQQAWRVDAR